MILGMSTATFTLLHVIISLVGIGSGFVVAVSLRRAQWLPLWTALFLATTILTSVTGFLFHSKNFGPPQVVGVISLVVLAIGLLALYRFHLAGGWRGVYVVCALAALYFNVFVAVTQAFDKVPTLHSLAPTGTEAPFAVVQLAVLAVFVALGVSAFKRFRPLSLPAPA